MEISEGNGFMVTALAHSAWANVQLLDACAGLTEAQLALTAPGTYGSIAATLLHLVANEQHYLGLLTDTPPAEPLRRGVFPGVAALAAVARSTGAGLAHAASVLRVDTILMPEFQGQPTELPARIVLAQALDHGREHRTHVATILTQHGLTPPVMDAWTYNGAGEPPPA